MGKIAFVFAGQGAQTPGMGKDVYDAVPAAAEVFDDALQAGLGGNGSGNSSAGPQYLLSVPVL